MTSKQLKLIRSDRKHFPWERDRESVCGSTQTGLCSTTAHNANEGAHSLVGRGHRRGQDWEINN